MKDPSATELELEIPDAEEGDLRENCSKAGLCRKVVAAKNGSASRDHGVEVLNSLCG